MKLITNTKFCNHKTVLVELIEWADECYFCTSFFNKKGLDCILPALISGISNRAMKVKIYSNGESKYTESNVILKLKKIPEIEHEVVLKKGRRLHSKIYLFEKGSDFQVIIGSANLTDNGLRKNEELSTIFKGVKGSIEHSKIKEYFDQLTLLSNA